MKILVTGAAGFVGARFVESATVRGAKLISVDDAQAFDSRPEHRFLDFGTRVDLDDLWKFLGELEPSQHPSAIVHLGACTDTTETRLDFLRTRNVEYSQALFRFATEHRIPMVYASSAATYGAGERGYTDDEGQMALLKPLNPYGDSKLQFDLWALDQEELRKTPPTWAGFKFFNVYGFGERHKGKMASLVTKAYDQIQKAGRVTLFRSHKPGVPDGHQARDFVFVEDVVQVLWFALEHPVTRGIYNLGSGRARTFLDLVRATFRACQVPEAIDWVDTPVEIRAQYQYFTEASLERLRSVGYAEPMTALEAGVAKTVERLKRGR